MTLMEAAPRETAHEAGGYLKGVAVALVTQNKDDEGLCRVKVRFPWHDKPRESHWARLATPMAGKKVSERQVTSSETFNLISYLQNEPQRHRGHREKPARRYSPGFRLSSLCPLCRCGSFLRVTAVSCSPVPAR